MKERKFVFVCVCVAEGVMDKVKGDLLLPRMSTGVLELIHYFREQNKKKNTNQ